MKTHDWTQRDIVNYCYKKTGLPFGKSTTICPECGYILFLEVSRMTGAAKIFCQAPFKCISIEE